MDRFAVSRASDQGDHNRLGKNQSDVRNLREMLIPSVIRQCTLVL